MACHDMNTDNAHKFTDLMNKCRLSADQVNKIRLQSEPTKSRLEYQLTTKQDYSRVSTKRLQV